jgi:hypothetical protein
MTTHHFALVAVLGGLAIALVGCGDQISTAPSGAGTTDAGASTAPALPAPDYMGRYQVSATVLERPNHGPQLCNAVAESYPPQCGGPDIVGWDWDAVEAESASGTTWGTYLLTGTWDGTSFTVTEPPAPPEEASGSMGSPDLTTPCPEPEGGWQPVDPAKATEADQVAAVQRAQSSRDFAGAWIDQPHLDALKDQEASDTELEAQANDPARYILNLMFTGDIQAHEQAIREVWGGALCVSPAQRSEAELMRIVDEIDLPGQSTAGIDTAANTVHVQLVVADTSMQEEVDARYGQGAVRLESWLQPID